MVWKRSAPVKGRGRKRARPDVPAPRRMAMYRNPTPTTVRIKRDLYFGHWNMTTAATNGFWRYVQNDMTGFPNFAEYASVFDEYKVHGIKWTFRPSYDWTDASVSSALPKAYAHIAVDAASTLIPAGIYNAATLNTFLENDNIKTYDCSKTFSVYFKPKVLGQVNATGTAARVEDPGWIRTTETGALLRGFHMFLVQNNFQNVNTQVKLDQYVTYYISFRNLR